VIDPKQPTPLEEIHRHALRSVDNMQRLERTEAAVSAAVS
jgi:hypothetical protein